MTRGFATKSVPLVALAFSLVTASADTININPKDPGLSQSITLTVTGLAPFTGLRYQFSQDGTNWYYLDEAGLWWDNRRHVYDCLPERDKTCTLVVPAPGTETTVMVRIVVRDSSGAWHFGSKTNTSVSWTHQSGQVEPGQDSADFGWNSPMGEFNSMGTIVGSSAKWTWSGRGSNGTNITCHGGTNSGGLARPKPEPGQWTIGRMTCDAVAGAKKWHYDGPARYFESTSWFATGWAWLGCHADRVEGGGRAQIVDRCIGTYTDEGGTKPVGFASIYIRYTKLP